MMDDQSARILSVLNKTYPLKLFTDQQREEIAAQSVVDEIEEGTIIYHEHDEATTINLILSGEVHLYWMADEEDEEAGEIGLGNLEPGDVFGLEALEEESTYAETAVALSLVRVVRFSLEFLDPYFEENALPYNVLMLMLSSLRLFYKVDLPWRDPDESIIFMARRNSVFLVYRMILPVFIFAIRHHDFIVPDRAEPGRGNPGGDWGWCGCFGGGIMVDLELCRLDQRLCDSY